MPFWGGWGFQNLVGLTYSQLESLHDGIMVWLTIIISLVLFIFYKVLMSPLSHMGLDSETLEKTWTLIPMVILLTIAMPSLHLLCLQDAMCQMPNSSIKVISNQWNWQSELDSAADHLLDVEELDNLGSYEVPMVTVSSGVSRVLLTSTDVLHSLGLPSLGVKLDSAPGRLNTTTVEVFVPGLYLGSCYELCGSGHSAMPINMMAL